ncbi:MAG: energy-coupling factor ABC transporter permease [Methanomassiliicoccales archaeon]|nr:MAG: energy-coupling factor ABC transporter permease [Methanomassiliicoccales archaeon]
MHIPDGLMEPIIWGIGWIIALVFVALASRILNKRIHEKQIPLMAVLAAGIFVAQMINFPIGGGTSGHLIGAALAAMLLGPYAGLIVITTILIIQCLIFGDGGITALGLNIVNMGIIGCFVGWGVHKIFPEKYRTFGIFLGSWTAVFIGAFICALELAISFSLSNGAFGIPAHIAVPTMLGYHAIIGIGEGIITMGIISYLSHTSPDILKMPKITIRTSKEVAVE